TVAPARASSSAAARPLRARPTTLISPRVHAAGSASVSERTGTSANLERAEGEEGADDADDPEPHHDLLLAPPLHHEVMVERCSKEDAVLARILHSVAAPPVFEHESLQEHRHCFREEDGGQEDEQELRLEQDRDGTHRAAQRERARVTH